MPDEVQLNQEYDKRTEIYFVGTLFRRLLKDSIDDFRFSHILEKMTKINPMQRYSSFNDITSDISAGVLGEIDFSDEEKDKYRNFAEALESHVNYFANKYSPISDIPLILSKLAELIRHSSLEQYIQDNRQLIRCFIDGGYSYINRKDIRVQTVIDFYELAASLPSIKQKILFDNIYTRLSSVKIQVEEDDLPF